MSRLRAQPKIANLGEMTWHVLDAGSIWVKEFASALDEFVPTLGWLPEMSWTGFAQNWERAEKLSNPPLLVHHFPLQRGYSRFPISAFSRLGERQRARMLRHLANANNSPLICTTPYYAPVAERWPGPVVYYQTDLTFAYAGADPKLVLTFDKRLCRTATLVCPNSRRVSEYMTGLAGCDPAKIEIVPNATRETNILARPSTQPGAAPADMAGLERPVIGVLGNLAANLNWSLLAAAIEKTPGYTWAFIGPTNMPVPEPAQNEARERLLKLGHRVRFLGPKPYAALQEYARAVDCAVLPYRRKEPTFSGSSTRFYEHLAACRPMIATRGFEELLRKEPLLTLVDTPEQLVAALKSLADCGFRDGLEEQRWEASKQGTWQVRAASVIQALQARYPKEFSVNNKERVSALAISNSLNATTGNPEPFTLVAPD